MSMMDKNSWRVTLQARRELKTPVHWARVASANRSFAVLDNGRYFLAFARGDAPVFTLSVQWQQRLR
jgi:hypothetical protein